MSVWIPPNGGGTVPALPRNNQTGYRVKTFGWPKIDILITGLEYAVFYIVVVISQVRSYKNIPCRFFGQQGDPSE